MFEQSDYSQIDSLRCQLYMERRKEVIRDGICKSCRKLIGVDFFINQSPGIDFDCKSFLSTMCDSDIHIYVHLADSFRKFNN